MFEIAASLITGNIAYGTDWTVALGGRPQTTDIAKINIQQLNCTRHFLGTVLDLVASFNQQVRRERHWPVPTRDKHAL